MLVPQTTPPFPLRWGFSTKQDAALSLPLARLSQVHGCDVLEASDAVKEGDGLWTTTPGMRIGVRVADCAPILLAGPLPDGRPWVSALHAGWRGATAGIFRRGIQVFQDLGGYPGDLVWALGPALQICHFEVGPEVIAAAQNDPAWHDRLQRPGPRGKPHFDLHAFLKAQAADLGLNPANDGSLALCTRCQSDLLFSYRAGDLKARQWGWVEIG